MRCSYCYNPEIVFGKAKHGYDEVKPFLLSRIGLLDAVVMSGGECLMYPDIIDFIQDIKSLGYLVKIDTNGSKPDTLKHLLDNNLIDYVSLDFKATLKKTSFITKADFYAEFLICCTHLINSKIPFEVRTTYHSDLLTTADISEMVQVLEDIGYKGNYFIQPFKNEVETIKTMNFSYINIDFEQFTTENIEVVVR